VRGVTTTRYRCTACGNLTRFDVTTTRTVRAFNHYSVGGDLHVEDEEVLAESTDEVVCRWCGHGRGITVLEADDAGAAPAP
jgi:DNA-directed RNA polymerase subunit RPC12/RpoP